MSIPQNGQIHSKQFFGKLPTNCLSVFDYFVGLSLKWLMWWWQDQNIYNVQNVKQKNYGNKNLFFSSLVFFKLEKKKSEKTLLPQITINWFEPCNCIAYDCQGEGSSHVLIIRLLWFLLLSLHHQVITVTSHDIKSVFHITFLVHDMKIFAKN